MEPPQSTGLMIPRVAVVIPCFNYGRFIEETVASVQRQEPCEIVVVDDGSDDQSTLQVLRRLADSGIQVLRHENRGLSEARMTGVRATSAAYVHVLDADDLLAPGAITALADVLDARPDLAAAWGHYQTFGANSCRFPCAPSLDPWRITYIDEIPATAMVRRDAIACSGGWSMGSGYEDWDFWMNLAELGYTGTGLGEVTLLYRVHHASMYSRSRERHGEIFDRIRGRHPDLFAARASNRRSSTTPWPMKLLFSLISGVPRLPERRRYQLYTLVRYYCQPHMSSSCYLSPLQRLRRRAAGARSAGRAR